MVWVVMPDENRRNFMKFAGSVIGFSAILSSSGPVAAATTQEELPSLRGPYADEDWLGYRGGPGHTGAVDASPDVNSDDPECQLFYDGPFAGEPAIADGTMYIADGEGHVVALDAETADLEWTSDDGVAGRFPSVAYHRVVTTGEGSVLALAVEDGTHDWETDLPGEIQRPSVGYETVFVIAGNELHALDVEDGSTKWTRTDETFYDSVAVGNGQVYAVVESEDSANNRDLVSLDVTTGDERWRTEPRRYVGYGPTAATELVTASGGLPDRNVYDADSGEYRGTYGGESTPAHDDEVYSYTTDYELRTTFFGDREGWTFGSNRISAISTPTVAGDDVYTYFGEAEREDRKQYEHSLLAFDRYTGEIQWSCETQEVDEPIDHPTVATSEAIYVLGSDEIHVVRGESSGGEEPTRTEDESSADEEDATTDDEDSSTPEETATPEETETPEETATPDDSDSECGCPHETDTPGSSASGDTTPTDTTTATDEDTTSTVSTTSTDEETMSTPTNTSAAGDTAGDTATATEETDGAGPGLGVVSTLSSLGGIGYVLHRRLGGDSSEQDGPER